MSEGLHGVHCSAPFLRRQYSVHIEMSSRSSPQSEISFSIEPPGKNNIDCDERKEEPSLSPIANRLAADLIPSMNEVDNGGGKGEVRHKFQNIAVRFV